VFQVSIFRRGLPVADAVARIEARLDAIVPELGAAGSVHLDWYLADLLTRYEHDALPSTAPAAPAEHPPTPPTAADARPPHHHGLMARVDEMATVLEQRRRRR
jgi:hypothetical protein